MRSLARRRLSALGDLQLQTSQSENVGSIDRRNVRFGPGVRALPGISVRFRGPLLQSRRSAYGTSSDVATGPASEAAEPLPAASVRFGPCQRGSRQSACGQLRSLRLTRATSVWVKLNVRCPPTRSRPLKRTLMSRTPSAGPQTGADASDLASDACGESEPGLASRGQVAPARHLLDLDRDHRKRLDPHRFQLGVSPAKERLRLIVFRPGREDARRPADHHPC